jgi:sulfur carrier protein
MIVSVNGDDLRVAAGATVADVVKSLAAERGLAPDGRGLAVALHSTVVPRSEWSSTVLAPGAVLEVLVAVQGG